MSLHCPPLPSSLLLLARWEICLAFWATWSLLQLPILAQGRHGMGVAGGEGGGQ